MKLRLRNILIASLAIAAGGCGDGHGHSATRTATAPQTSSSSTASASVSTSSAPGGSGPMPTSSSCAQLPFRHRFITAPADALVQMEQEPPSMIAQWIYIRPNGSGLVTTLVGEVVGAYQVPIRLNSGQLSTLKRLIAATATPGHASAMVNHSGYIIQLHLHGHASVSFDGNTPTRYGALARFLYGLIYLHC